MKIVVYGLVKEMPEGATVSEVLQILGEPAKHVLVEVNGRYVGRRDYGKVKLREGDRFDVIYPAFGG
jgi:thiamine biosynthesis protein ThiS